MEEKPTNGVHVVMWLHYISKEWQDHTDMKKSTNADDFWSFDYIAWDYRQKEL